MNENHIHTEITKIKDCFDLKNNNGNREIYHYNNECNDNRNQEASQDLVTQQTDETDLISMD